MHVEFLISLHLHTLEHNSVIKHHHCHVVETRLSLLHFSSLPFHYWLYAFQATVYLITHVPSFVLSFQNPRFLVDLPIINNLKCLDACVILGCTYIPHLNYNLCPFLVFSLVILYPNLHINVLILPLIVCIYPSISSLLKVSFLTKLVINLVSPLTLFEMPMHVIPWTFE